MHLNIAKEIAVFIATMLELQLVIQLSPYDRFYWVEDDTDEGIF